MNIFDKFFELLIGSNEIVDCLTSMQHSSVVTIPIWEPMFAKEAFVNF
jgi:hypothetical protein